MFNLNGHQQNGTFTHLQQQLQQITDDVIAHAGCVLAVITTTGADRDVKLRAHTLALPRETAVAVPSAKAPTTLTALKWGGQRRRSISMVNTLPGGNSNGRNFTFNVVENLYDALRPVIDKTTADWMQAELDVSQVVSLPITLDGEPAGTLIAATSQEFDTRDLNILAAFGRQAASTLQTQQYFDAMAVLEQVILSLQATVTNETHVLQQIVDAVVQDLGYAGAMVATLEAGNRLPVRAYQVDVAPDLLQQLQNRAGISLIGPKAVVLLDDEKYQDNLSVRAVRGNQGRAQKYAISHSLHDLFRPIVAKPLSDVMQRIIGIQQVIAVPFLMSDKVMGNLFVATRKPTFTNWEISMLTTLGQQAAVGIRNARLYREANEHLEVAEMFGRMAFSATASVHSLRNHISAVSAYLDLLGMVTETADTERVHALLARSQTMSQRMHRAAGLLDHLHEPWQQPSELAVDVNDCVSKAVKEVFPELLLDDKPETVTVGMGITLHFALAPDLPHVQASPDMMTEAFRVLVKNATEAILEKPGEHTLRLISRRHAPDMIEVIVHDSGSGIRPENLPHIFKMGWSTKKGQGMGFGLFWTRDFINGLGGEISVESSWGSGAAFHIYLPVMA